MSSEGMSPIILIIVPWYVKTSQSLASLHVFSLSFSAVRKWYGPGIDFFGYLFYLDSQASWICGLVSLSFGKLSAITTSNIPSAPFPLLVYCLCTCILFEVVPQLLGILFCICHSFFSLNFSLRSFYWHIFRLIYSFLSQVWSPEEPIKGILYFCYCF